MARHYLFTSESVTEGHPDKVCDQISDAVLDAILEQDPNGRVACETTACTGLIHVMGEITTSCYVDIAHIAREVVRDIGYDRGKYGFDCDTCAVVTSIDEQSADIAMGVDKSLENKEGTDSELSNGAGDQGMMFGYACDETLELMPLPLSLAQKLCKRMAEVRKSGQVPYMRPDGKSQVTVEYDEHNRPVRVDTVVITGEKRYAEAEIRQASGVEDGDNLFLLNKYQVIRNIAEALPYIEIENTRIQRKLPDTLLIQVQECGDPLAWTQDGTVWLMSPAGKIVEQTDTAAGYPTVDGCELLSPSVGTQIAVDTAYETRRESLLELLAVLDETGDLAKVDAIHLGEAAYISMDYMDRFTVKIPYQADFSYKLRVLELAINSDKIQDNMTGTFDMRQEDGQVIFDQDTRK